MNIRLFSKMLAAISVLIPALLPAQALAQDLFQGCEADSSRDYAYYYCFFETAGQKGAWAEATQRLEEMTQTSGWAWLALGHIQAYGPVKDFSEAKRLYRKAADQLSREGEIDGEVLAFSNAYEMLHQQDRIGSEESRDLLEQALEAVDGQDGTLAQARAWTLQARSLIQESDDLGRAYRLLKAAEGSILAPSQHDYRLKIQFLNHLGSVLNGLGRFQDAQAAYRTVGELAQKHNSQYTLPTARYNLAAALLSELEELPDEERRRQVLQLAQDALQAASQANQHKPEIKAHLMIASLLNGIQDRREEARGHYNKAIELARERDSSMLSVAQWGLAWSLIKDDRREEAGRIIERIRAQGGQDQASSNFAARTRLLSSWALEDRERAIQVSHSVLKGVEGQRGRQEEASSREGFFSAWTSQYYLFSGQLLSQQPLTREALKSAFAVIEQMRARVLLEALSAGKATDAFSPQLDRIHDQISRIRQRLRSGPPSQQAREFRAQLRGLELEETRLRSQVFQEQLQDIQANREFATLAQVQERLGADEALLSFQVGLWEDLYGDFGGGSWLLVSTKNDTRAYPLKVDRRWLERGMPLFLGLIERRDGMESQAASSIYARIFQQALEELPSPVNKLIVVPDGALHHLPFGVLPLPQGTTLGEQYQVSIVPSATLWLGWRDQPPAQAKIPVLALADPELPPIAEAEPADGTRRRDWTAEPLLPLPSARQEGSQLVRRLGRDSRLVVGGQASEQFIKSADLQQFAVLHFATHALVDDEYPDRSAVMLAAGDDQEDGRLQIREIVDLGLDGRVIVLSACSSATGALLSGEGVIGLARAFFRAGANSVVGSLWPLRDDDAQEFFEAFYDHLSQGYSIASALKAAQTDRIQQGEPAQAWAGLVVLGDGNYIPFPGGLPQASPLGNGLFTLIAALATAFALGAHLLLRQRKRSLRLG